MLLILSAGGKRARRLVSFYMHYTLIRNSLLRRARMHRTCVVVRWDAGARSGIGVESSRPTDKDTAAPQHSP